jgi:carbonic anhydrase
MQIRHYTYSKNVLNKVVCHTTEAEPITDWLYVHKELPDQWGRIEVKFYAYYPEIKTG